MMKKLTKNENARMTDRFYQWYRDAYSSDDILDDYTVDEKMTIEDAWSHFNGGGEIYEIVPYDSVYRERVFNLFSQVTGKTYGEIYDMWLNGNIKASTKKAYRKGGKMNKSIKKSIDEDKTKWVLSDCVVFDKYDHLLVVWDDHSTQEIVPNSPSDYNDCREELTRMELWGDALSNAGWEDGAGNPVEQRSSLSAHELRDMANSLYDGGYRADDIEDIMFQFDSDGLTREEAEKICEILGEIESRTEKSRKSAKKSITPIKSFDSLVKSQREKNSGSI